MDLGLRGRTALITGGSGGIGAATAKAMAAEGANLILVARTQSNLERTREDIRRVSAIDVEIAACDLSEEGQITALAERFGGIDVVVNNAGAVPSGSLFEISEARWRQGWDSKVFPYIAMCRAFYPVLQRRGGGAILNVLGNGSRMKRFDYVCGGMANAALDFFTEALGAGSPADNIRVIGISPGPVDTERYRTIAQQRCTTPTDMPFGRIPTPEEIGAIITIAASARCSYMSGTVVVVDGGMSSSRAAPPSDKAPRRVAS
jgi:3-oxoacyl-[acyl-carrier protein] reductase